MGWKIDLAVSYTFSKHRHNWSIRSGTDSDGLAFDHHPELARPSGATRPKVARSHHIRVPLMLRLGGLTAVFLWLELIIIVMKYWLQLNLQIQSQLPNYHFLSCTECVCNIISLRVYSIRMQKTTVRIQKTIVRVQNTTVRQGGLYIRSTFEICRYFLTGLAVCYEINFWVLTFWLTQMICSGDVSTSWYLCQVLFMFSCPRGTCKSILHPQAVRGEEKHWSLILSRSTPFSAPCFIPWPGFKWASNTNAYLYIRSGLDNQSWYSFLLIFSKPC